MNNLLPGQIKWLYKTKSQVCIVHLIFDILKKMYKDRCISIVQLHLPLKHASCAVCTLHLSTPQHTHKTQHSPRLSTFSCLPARIILMGSKNRRSMMGFKKSKVQPLSGRSKLLIWFLVLILNLNLTSQMSNSWR